MTKKTNILHTAKLKNNCPTCFGTDGLELKFTQDEDENAFFHKPNRNISETLYCHNCKNPIYPVNWTEDIERVYDYNKKIAETRRQYLSVKPLFYILIVLAIIVIGALGYIFLF
ncbi:hypothetical protein EI546_09090 [Aequorivita sp. H23M31]|uniref:Uncharacterized protein n=1 Tax=Aequorivita ciconiae TaxID=2494375 RepID=A0A410G3S1_9FLAO|nr:hypothetical protein [Aequorivita sp. H23M31]QAA81865.1 hypothetical protein EI546_09090 [Aequorivita sp. H23M31]